ncbi:hypothetical protein AAF712_004406 [Marasmius tenuissimus]|uniref:Uncharacterized protein n=1 Tax=Marasmius tenuissimus TaxID=585030 RepID=A0ABR3A5B0_9AGAR
MSTKTDKSKTVSKARSKLERKKAEFEEGTPIPAKPDRKSYDEDFSVGLVKYVSLADEDMQWNTTVKIIQEILRL